MRFAKRESVVRLVRDSRPAISVMLLKDRSSASRLLRTPRSDRPLGFSSSAVQFARCVRQMAEILDLFDNVIVELQFDELIEPDQVVNFEDVLV